MSDVNPKVLALVERELKKDPDVASTTLQEKAAKVDRSVASLTGRQFHARYGLLARRKLSGPKRRKAASQKKGRRKRDHDPARALLIDGYRRQMADVEEAAKEAFDRAIKDDSVARANRVLSALERCAEDCRKA